jgi:hypothetical protein
MSVLASPKNNKIETSMQTKIFWILLSLFCFVTGVYARWEALEQAYPNEWAIRDFDRAIHLFNGDYFPLAGPETNNGGRLPGPFLYILLTIPLFFHLSYDSITYFNFFLNILCIPLIFFTAKKYFGLSGGIIASILLATSTLHAGAVSEPMNPTFIFPFIILFFYFRLGHREHQNIFLT